MKKLALALTLLGLAFHASPARAQLSLDLKVGYALPLGDVASVDNPQPARGSLSGLVSSSIPIEVAGRWRFTPNLSAGLYFQYDPAFVAKSLCLSAYSCSATDTRVGVEVAYGFLPDRFVNPWVSLGTGWEWTSLTVNVPAGQASAGAFSATFSGWEYLNLQVGADLNVSRNWSVGPWVGFFAGSYSSRNDWAVASSSIPSANRTFHGWVQFGAKGTLNL